MAHLAGTASRQEGHDGPLFGKPEAAAGRGTVLAPELFRERVADEAGLDAVPPAELGLEREQGEYPVDRPPDLGRAIGPPRPHRGADVVDGGDPGPPEPAFEREVEVRRVDPDEHVRGGGFEAPRETPPLRDQLDEAPDRLEEAHDREALHREEGVEPERLHLRAADPAEPGLGLGSADGAHEPRPEQVAGHLAGDDRDGGPRHRRPWRTMPRVEAARNSIRGATSGQPSRISSRRSRASGTRRPFR